MAKAPVAGRSKTRLARGIGVAAATSFARHALRITLLRLSRDPRWETLLAVAPDMGLSSPMWPVYVPRFAQGAGDLGQRMQRIFARVGPGPVLIIGSDIPGIEPSHIARAFRELGGNDIVFGPATDGGYWLVGMKRRPREIALFEGVRWSTSHALADTMANATGYRIGFTARLDDIDDADSLKDVGRATGRVTARRDS